MGSSGFSSGDDVRATFIPKRDEDDGQDLPYFWLKPSDPRGEPDDAQSDHPDTAMGPEARFGRQPVSRLDTLPLGMRPGERQGGFQTARGMTVADAARAYRASASGNQRRATKRGGPGTGSPDGTGAAGAKTPTSADTTAEDASKG
jgi:hypothetical protein